MSFYKMFTGIIQEIGQVQDIEKTKSGTVFSIKASEVIKNKTIGQSIAVNGICTTITKIDKTAFSFHAMPETLKRTNINKFKIGSKVNLEAAMRLNESLDGHLVQGHIDTTCIVKKIENDKTKKLTISFNHEISPFLSFKGAITINGVSLTISDLQENTFSVDLIPYTLEKTNLGDLKTGDEVNIEVDLISRYIKRLMDCKEKEVKYEFLKERGFI